MNVFLKTVDIAIVFLCSFIAYKALYRYYKEPVNYENVFYWGLSFILMGITYVVGVIYDVTGIKVMNSALMSLWETLRIWLQLFAISLSIFCPHNCYGESEGVSTICSFCYKKRVRIIMWIVWMLTLSIFTTMLLTQGNTQYYEFGIYLTGNLILDTGIDILQMIFAIAILIILGNVQGYALIRFAYIVIIIKKIVDIYLLAVYGYNIEGDGEPLLHLYRTLKAISVLAIFVHVYKIMSVEE